MENNNMIKRQEILNEGGDISNLQIEVEKYVENETKAKIGLIMSLGAILGISFGVMAALDDNVMENIKEVIKDNSEIFISLFLISLGVKAATLYFWYKITKIDYEKEKVYIDMLLARKNESMNLKQKLMDIISPETSVFTNSQK